MDKEKPRRRSQIGFYRAGITSSDRLEATTIGRDPILVDLLEKLEATVKKKTHQHYVLAGPRGVGKTHFLSLLAHRIRSSSTLSRKFTIVRFAEETHRLLSFADFLLRVSEILGNEPGHDEWQTLYQELAEQDDDREIIDTLEPRLNHYRQDTGRLLLLLVENLDEILMRQIKGKQGMHQLRKLLMSTPSCVLIATTPIVFPGLTDVRQPFYDFFDIQTLDNLTQAETLEVIRANLVYDQRNDLIDRFDELSPKIKALHEMTGGNPRLIMMHYALIADEDVLEVKQQFEELLDRISPFYQDRVKDLPPQERAVLETMALIRTQPKTPALIARRLRKSPQQTASLLKRLTRSGYLVVMDHPSDKRSKIYRIKEGFFDIWLSMNESRQQRKRLPALTEFFELWYERKEREEKRCALIDRLLAGDLKVQDKQVHTTTLDYLSDVGPDDEKIAAKLKLAALIREPGQSPEQDIYLDEIKALKPDGVVQWLTDHREVWIDNPRWTDPIQQIEQMITCWQFQRAGQLEEFAARLLKIGRSLQDHGLHQALSELFLSSAEELGDSDSKATVLLQAARSQKMMGDLNAALDTLKNALELVQAGNDRRAEAIIVSDIGQNYHASGDSDAALDYFRQSLKICQETKDREGHGAVLGNIAQIFLTRGDFDTALNHFQQSLKINREIGFRAGEAINLNSISKIYWARGDDDTALNNLLQSIEIHRDLGDRAGEGNVLNGIGTIYLGRGNTDKALDCFQQSFKIRQEIGDRVGESVTLQNMGQAYYTIGENDKALNYLHQSLKISKEIEDRVGMISTLHNLAIIADFNREMKKYFELETQAYRISREMDNAMGLYYVGRSLGTTLVESGLKEEGLMILHESLTIGKKAGMSDVQEIENLIQKYERD